jgi:site-specific DNA-methyltransferase (adenine-specific)
LLLSDPPYMTDVADIAAFAAEWLPLALRKLAPSGRAYVFTGSYPEELHAYLSVLRDYPHTDVLAWGYNNTIGPAPSHDYKRNWQAIFYVRGPQAPRLNCPVMSEQFSLQVHNAPDGRLDGRLHAWQKPDTLAEMLIRHSTSPGDTIADPFAGTGTFLLAASRLGRHAVGCDIDPDMIALAVSRGCQRAS